LSGPLVDRGNLIQAAKVDSTMQRTNHREDAETVFG
jgi:hypothetical protein